MNELILETNDSPEVAITAHDRLRVKSWDRNEVRARSSDENLALEQSGDAHVSVSSDDALEVRVPIGSSLTINAYDDAAVQGVMGTIRVEQASGSLVLKDAGFVEIDQVGNDLNASRLGGSLTAKQVGRFANLREIEGAVQLDFISSHLNMKNVAGNIEAEADGNVNLYLELKPGQNVKVRTQGVLTCRVPIGLNATVKLESGGPIKVKAGDVREVSQDRAFEKTFGDGAASLELYSDGPLSLIETASESKSKEFDFDFNFASDIGDIGSHIGENVGEQLASQMEMIGEQLESSMKGFSALIETWDLSPEKTERLQNRTKEKIARAQRKIEQAQKMASRKIEQAQRRAERQARKTAQKSTRWQKRGVVIGGRRSKPDAEPVSDQERMMILNMLAEKKIDMHQAEALLAALEGK